MALIFDGTDDFVTHGDLTALEGATAATVMGWFYFTSVSANDTIIGKFGSYVFFVTNAANDWRVGFATTGAPSLTAPPALNTWVHLALRYEAAGATDDDKSQIFLDGVKQASVSFVNSPPASLPATTTDFEVYGDGNSAGAVAAGRAALIKVWAAALSAAEIVADMNSYLPRRTANLLLWAPYDDGTAARDYSTQGNHGTITGAIQVVGPPVGFGAPDE